MDEKQNSFIDFMMNILPMRCPTGVENTLPANELTLKKDDMFSSYPCVFYSGSSLLISFFLFSLLWNDQSNRKYTSLALKINQWIWFVIIVAVALVS